MEYEHPADANQGRGLDYPKTQRTLSDWIKDAAIFAVVMLAWIIWGDEE